MYKKKQYQRYQNEDDEIIEKLKQLQVRHALEKLIRKENLRKEEENKRKNVNINNVSTTQSKVLNNNQQAKPTINKQTQKQVEDDMEDLLV